MIHCNNFETKLSQQMILLYIYKYDKYHEMSTSPKSNANNAKKWNKWNNSSQRENKEILFRFFDNFYWNKKQPARG